MRNKIKVIRVSNVSLGFVHIRNIIAYSKAHNEIDLKLVSSRDDYANVLIDDFEQDVDDIEIPREISIIKDFIAIFKLIVYLKKERPNIVHSFSPKGALVTCIAGLFNPGVKVIHTFTGQRWATMKGPLRWIQKTIDKAVIMLNDSCFADSFSQIDYLISEGVARPGDLKCIHNGSFGGIDTVKFNNENYPSARGDLIEEINIEIDSLILLYVGRVTKDKGINELVRAFVKAKEENNKLELVLIGPSELKEGELHEDVSEALQSRKDIHSLGFKSNPEVYFSASDIFCLPSYREGFGTVVLEAGGCELLTIGTKIPGLVDAIVDGETGILVERYSVAELKDAILEISSNQLIRENLSRNAKERARRDFQASELAELTFKEYRKLLN